MKKLSNMKPNPLYTFKHYSFTVVSCVVLSCMSMHAAAQTDKRITQAEQYFAKGDYYTAAKLFEQYLAPSSKQIVQANFPLNSKRRRTAAGTGAGKGVTKNDILYRKAESYRLANYLNEAIKWSKSIAGQRSLMTSNLREKVKDRDNYKCCICGLGIKDEPNLLLEIDHKIPLSKGGMTTFDNLQTLCWKCNRAKGAKILT